MFGCTGHCIDFFSITLWFFLSRVLFLPLIPAATDLTMLYWDNFYKTFMSASKCGISEPREVILLIDHSGSMEGEKWEAADKAATELIGRLTDKDFFNVEIFHDQSKWFNSGRPNRPRCRTSSEPANSLTVIRLQAVQNLESRWSRLYLCRERRALRLDISFSLPMARYRISLGYYDWPMKKESYRTGGLFMSYRSTCHRTHCLRDNWHLVQE